jgi:hypothetical protein
MRKAGAKPVAVLIIAALLSGSLSCAVFDGLRESAEGSPGTDTASPPPLDRDATALPNTQVPDESSNAMGEPPRLTTTERLHLAYPLVSAGGTAPLVQSRAINGDVFEWPEIRYLREDSQIWTVGFEPVSVKPVEIRIVQGGSIPFSYSPELDMTRPEPEGSPPWFRSQLDRPVLLIPPNASLVMVRIETTPSPGYWAGRRTFVCPEGSEATWRYRPSDFRMGYPGLAETRVNLRGDSFWFGEYQAAGYGCPGSGWLYFIVPEVSLDPSLVWLAYISGTSPGQLAFWRLRERP